MSTTKRLTSAAEILARNLYGEQTRIRIDLVEGKHIALAMTCKPTCEGIACHYTHIAAGSRSLATEPEALESLIRALGDATIARDRAGRTAIARASIEMGQGHPHAGDSCGSCAFARRMAAGYDRTYAEVRGLMIAADVSDAIQAATAMKPGTVLS